MPAQRAVRLDSHYNFLPIVDGEIVARLMTDLAVSGFSVNMIVFTHEMQ